MRPSLTPSSRLQKETRANCLSLRFDWFRTVKPIRIPCRFEDQPRSSLRDPLLRLLEGLHDDGVGLLAGRQQGEERADRLRSFRGIAHRPDH